MTDSLPPSQAHGPVFQDHSRSDAACRVALLTPPGRGAVATILVLGPGALVAVTAFFQSVHGRNASFLPEFRIVYGNWLRGDPASSPDRDPPSSRNEDVVLVRHGPEHIEIHCHGGESAAEAILEDLITRGCQRTCGLDWLAECQSSPLAGQAVRQLVQAPTLRTAVILMDQVQGALDKALGAIVDQISQQRFASARQGLTTLLAHAHLGLHLVLPWQVVLMGPPNVGKSSLINALVGYQRAIVYEQPGTTRDVVRVRTALDGWPIELSDTAGLRDSQDAVEQEGIRRATQTAGRADLVLFVHDATQPTIRSQFNSPALGHTRWLHVHNKIDLVDSRVVESDATNRVSTSARLGQGIPELAAAIVERLVGRPPVAGTAVPFTRHQVAVLEEVCESCDQQQHAPALAALRRLLRDPPT